MNIDKLVEDVRFKYSLTDDDDPVLVRVYNNNKTYSLAKAYCYIDNYTRGDVYFLSMLGKDVPLKTTEDPNWIEEYFQQLGGIDYRGSMEFVLSKNIKKPDEPMICEF